MEKPRSWALDLNKVDQVSGLSPVELITKIGYAVLPDFLSPSEVRQFRDEVIALHLQERDLSGDHAYRYPHMVANNIVPRSRLFDHLLLHQSLLPIVEHFYGSQGNLLEFRAINLQQCNETPFMHKDSMTNTVPGSPLRLFMIVALDPFSSANGATFVIPGSHYFPFKPDPAIAEFVEPKILEMSPGSCLLFDANLWHGPTANTSGADRWALSLAFGHWFIKPQFNWIASISKDTFFEMPPRLQSLLGFNSRPPIDFLSRMTTVLSQDNISFEAT